MKIPYLEIEKDSFAPVVRLEIESPVRWIETDIFE